MEKWSKASNKKDRKQLHGPKQVAEINRFLSSFENHGRDVLSVGHERHVNVTSAKIIWKKQAEIYRHVHVILMHTIHSMNP